MKTRKVTLRLSRSEWAQLTDFSNQHQKPLSAVIRELALHALNFQNDESHADWQPKGKRHLMRAERAALFSAVMADLMLREQTPENKLDALKARARELLNSRWDYADE